MLSRVEPNPPHYGLARAHGNGVLPGSRHLRLFIRVQDIRDPELGQYEVPGENAEDLSSLVQACQFTRIVRVGLGGLAGVGNGKSAGVVNVFVRPFTAADRGKFIERTTVNQFFS
jgi:hypothetical protein